MVKYREAMKRKLLHSVSFLLVAALGLGVRAAGACDVEIVSGQPSSNRRFVAGRDAKNMKHYVIVSPNQGCAGMIIGRTGDLDRCFIVQRPSSRGEFLANMPDGVVGYIVSCKVSCLRNLTSGPTASLVGYLSGSKTLNGYIVRGSSRAISQFIAGCPSTRLRGLLVDRTASAIPAPVAGQPSNLALNIVTRSSYIRGFLVRRPSRPTKHYISMSPHSHITHILTHPRTSVREFIVGYPSTARPGFLASGTSRPGRSFIASTQCE